MLNILQRIEIFLLPKTDFGKLTARLKTKPLAILLVLPKHKSENVRRAAVEALGDLKDRQSTESLLEALNDISDAVREAAVKALGGLGDHRAVEPLINACQRSSFRVSIVEALGKLQGKRAIDYLSSICLFDDPLSATHRAANYAILESGDIDALLYLLKDRSSDDDFRVVAKRRLKALGVPRDKMTRGLVRALDTDSEETTKWAINELTEFTSDELLPVYTSELRNLHVVDGDHKKSSGDVRVGIAIAAALGRLRDLRAIEPLVEQLRNPNEGIREESVIALWNVSTARAIDPLMERWREEKSIKVRRALIGAFRQCKDGRVVDLLLPSLTACANKAERHQVRWLAARLINDLGEGREFSLEDALA